ncbi:MAG: FIG006542: Phosphoesterase [uncultured Campylobacterales bacterium]|uniref:FIG006542: Phosphoesterase n=1 Tax=uncultured Campylobacterales bacterium TaxID=352960 RepID=A0A6S6T4W8_9BACT|nr:MAG: FIG006542: Phosphoesterase [uncultured Campylobacterales bacterium]
MSLMNTENILRPINYPDTVAGNSTSIIDDTAIINVMGVFGLPSTPFNPFLRLEEEITSLKNNKIQNIIIDVHAEATSEKRAVYQMFKDEVNIIYGTHTHIGTDDLEIYNNRCSYVSDIGMTGSLDGIIGMDQANPIKRFKEGVSNALDVVKESNNNIFQFLVIDLEDSLIKSAQKIKLYTKDNQKIISTAVNL